MPSVLRAGFISAWAAALAVACVPQGGGGGEVITPPDQGVRADGGGGGAGGAPMQDMRVPLDMAPVPQCANGVDDDDDGLIDLRDPGCGSAADDDESDDPPPPACANGEDDDGDGFIDFPEDPGCGSDQDDDEGDDVAPLPQCLDGTDNDGDGYVDLADPGCASAADPRESDPEERPVCANGLDDDSDGIIDFPMDPGCSAAGDDDETDLAMPPACANGRDDDGDGHVDYPEDPGCAGRGDRDEGDPPIIPGCADGVDNDRDGATDWPADRGCTSAADTTEAATCGRDRDAVELAGPGSVQGSTRGAPFAEEGSCGGRGASETVYVYRLERAVEALSVRTRGVGQQPLETTLYVRRACLDPQTELACSRERADAMAENGVTLENPAAGEYFIVVDGATGASGTFELTVEEVPLAACLNGEDDDGDGRVDFPNDPGCTRASDRDETDPLTPPACANDEDDDGDGQVDFPLDPGCRSAADRDEADLCGPGVRFEDYPVGEPFYLGDTQGGTQQFQGTCGGGGVERILAYENPFNARITFSVNHPETQDNTVLYVRSDCDGANSELACSAGDARNQITKGSVTLERVAPGTLFIFVDQNFGLGGGFKLTAEVERLPPGCSDETDNDEDGFVDADDVGCSGPDDEDERDPDPEAGDPLPACYNQADDDGDGFVDFPLDPGCDSKGDVDEADPAQPPQCANGLDDDGDGVIDFPEDVGCVAAGDDDEGDANRPQCTNRIDDDQDGLTDYPLDPGCAGAGDRSERDEPTPPACADQRDNDRDGLVDFPFDPGCAAAGDASEADPAVPAACSNGLDDDGDGIIDFPRDPGCSASGDTSEADPAFAPQCANGLDDDRNGRVDWPDDPGCRFAGDPTESSDGAVSARCADGIDNDDDGAIDLADRGCQDARDDDETDPLDDPACDNGVDDDEDNIIDWPDDDGCAARGDLCEQPGFGLCDGRCLDLQNDVANCGRCGRACSEGVECNEGRCGELRDEILMCGRSSRDANQFVVGALAEAGVRVRVNLNGCDPTPDTQAVLVPRGGVNLFTQNSAAIQAYVQDGGIVISEYNISDEVYNGLFPERVVQGNRNGSCRDNIQPVTQANPQDPFWQWNRFVALPAANSGCGHTVDAFPGVTVLGGWAANANFIGYRDLGAGRAWLLDIDWQDSDAGFTEESVFLMASMIANGPVR
ncbi:MAG: hypothetical protein H6702_23620 [Myxococcales bacterium]|nr:hypothetical protein [Myxococcales bacterium]